MDSGFRRNDDKGEQAPGERTRMGIETAIKPRLSLGRIIQMNLGFLGLQFSFGLQQSNMGPIYSYLGADEAALPLLWLAGPVTGLIVQPFIGALSDRTVSRFGRRTPYFLIGAVLCSLCLFAMPYSSALWMAASLLWILDAANNVTMEPYRAYVSDRLGEDQRPLGFLTQSAFTGLAQTLSYLAPSLLVWWGMDKDAVDANGIPHITRVAFLIGAVLSISTILWSIWRVPELPLGEHEKAAMRAEPLTFATALHDLKVAIVEMPRPMRQLALAMLCQWYAMFCYWQYIAFAIGRSLFGTSDPGSAGFRDAVLLNGQVGGFYNFVAFIAAFAMVPFTKRLGAKPVHAACLVASGLAMIAIPQAASPAMLFAAVIGIGLGWGSMMGNPYVMLANSIPPERTGIYMGIFNMFIVIPMMIQSLTMPLIYRPLLGGDPRNVLLLAGGMMLAAAVATLWVRVERPARAAIA
jgi:maltose/moltooligosaccharide transporter